MKPIIFFHNNNDYTGSTRVLADVIAAEYADQRVSVVAYRNGNKGLLSQLPNVNIISYWKPQRHGEDIFLVTSQLVRLQVTLIALLIGWRYMAFYINTVVPFQAALVGRLYRKHIIYHVHEKFVQRVGVVPLMEWVFNHTKAHRIFVSRYTKEQYPDNPSCTWEIKYNKLSAEYLAKVRVKPIRERKCDTILMIASLSKLKGIFNFLDIAALLSAYRFRLMLSSDMCSIRSFIGDHPVPSNVELIPAQSDIHPYMYDADLLLNLSIPFFWVETFGMTILEVMAYGIPAIVPNVGGPTELITNGYNGYCTDVTDVHLVASLIEKALQPEEYACLVTNALSMFERFK